MSALATPAASVAGTGAGTGGSSPTPSGDLSEALGTPAAVEGGAGGATAEPEAGAEGSRPETGSEAQGADGGKPDARGEETGASEDGRVIPAKYRELFKRDPELKGLFFADRAFKKEFPGGLQEARALRETLELAGGEAGIERLQTDLGDFRTLATQFLDGDPGYVDDIFESDGAAAVQHLPHYLDKAAEADRPAYEREIARRIHAEHSAPEVNLRGALKSAYDAIVAGTLDDAKRILNGIASWHDKIKAIAEKEPDPEVQKLREQLNSNRKTNDEKELAEANERYKKKAVANVNASTAAVLDSFLKGRKFEDRDAVEEWIKNRVNAALSADEEFKRQRDSFGKRRDESRLLRLVTARWDRELKLVVPKAIRLFAAAEGKKQAPSAENGNAAARTAGGANEGFASVDKVPPVSSIDRYATTPEMIRKHRAVLKGGQKVDYSRALAG